MDKRQLTTGVVGFLGIFFLILDGKTALSGAAEGITLCIQTLIPSLFPFIVFSILLTGAFAGSHMPFLSTAAKIMHMPKGTESILVGAFLGGYPVGAQSVAAAYHSGQISGRCAQRMLSFCSNAGPSFLFGIIAAMFSQRHTVWILWGIHIISAWMVSTVFPAEEHVSSLSRVSSQSFSQGMYSAVKTMGMICGWVVVFRVILAFLSKWILWIFPIEIQILVAGLLELSNGCCGLLSVRNENLRFLICSALLSFGGLCVAMQTAAVVKGLSVRYYIAGKILQCFFSLILSAAYLYHQWYMPILCVVILSLFCGKTKKSCSNPTEAVV